MLRAFTVDDLLNINQFTSRCPWDLSPDDGLLAVTLSQGKRRVIDDTNYGENGAYIVLIDVEIRQFPISRVGRENLNISTWHQWTDQLSLQW